MSLLALEESSSSELDSEWLREVMQHLKLEKLRFTIRGSSDKFGNHLWITLELISNPPPS